ncbi:HAMP domain-containing histidine kinase [Mediterraneibacter glycyrrhizinilyticus]|uniref:sensor histidine kinase n=1 Tax=Mediterraneibacter glycyrrhizinilyticus TaxID=342942 RepID=UPI00196199E7|nr:HAMP domain-containing sensor histidine kinase [Mediterraneibacter glycyrrhizinilyticus]MBM6752064.1 HAMP domain-containing histidine kinase [Mediterraneibacter glycyrrhizinilyticus]
MREVPFIFFAAVLLAAVVLAAGCFYGWRRNRKMYRTIDRMLDEILDGEPISQSDIREGEISVLASKAKRVKEKVDLGISTAEEEKEQVKSLISNMSHQLKTPLAGLMMYREMLEDEGTDEEMRKRFLGKMKGQSEKIDWILKSLFKMVNLEQGAVVFEAEALPVRDTILDAVAASLDKADRRGIEILTEPFEDRLLWHNRKWTAEVLVNLLENAVKYTEPGGCITISVNPMEMYTEIEVRDTGRGIRKEELNEIFKRFYRSRDVENIEGSGIGLYLSRLILEQEKGYMTAESELGEGSKFSVFLQNCQNFTRKLSGQ